MKTFRVVVDGNEYQVEIEEVTTPALSQTKQSPTSSQTKPLSASNTAKPISVVSKPVSTTLAKTQPKQAPEKPTAKTLTSNGAIQAPMPGKILSIGVTKGDQVTKGRMLVVLEAMKMENEILAPIDGLVEDILISQSATVNTGDTLIILA